MYYTAAQFHRVTFEHKFSEAIRLRELSGRLRTLFLWEIGQAKIRRTEVRFCIAIVCWSLVETRAYSPARPGGYRQELQRISTSVSLRSSRRSQAEEGLAGSAGSSPLRNRASGKHNGNGGSWFARRLCRKPEIRVSLEASFQEKPQQPPN